MFHDTGSILQLEGPSEYPQRWIPFESLSRLVLDPVLRRLRRYQRALARTLLHLTDEVGIDALSSTYIRPAVSPCSL